ncbi:FYN-binding protein-like [Astyanax mexicanus]|uniref:FYN-binding protein-like n=1 Tax=Astyanax mexicanus TaxID=7994 RepID=A0A8T2KSK9_ASTMX|nr:FYN-binding protein-like [Astyanax mexicanus]
MYSGQAPRLKPHPLKPDIGGVSMEAKFKPPVPVGKLPGSAPQPSKPPGISALKVAPEKGKREEGKGAPPAPTYNHKPLGGKFPPANEENQPKFPGASFPKTPPSWKKPPLKEVSSQSPAPTESGSTHNVASSVQLQKKMFMGRANESESQKKEVSSNNSTPNETGSAHNAPVPKTPPSWKKPPLKEVSSQSPAPSETGSTHNVASSVQLQKKMFMGRASESESQKKDMSGNTSALNQTGSAHNVASSVQLQKKLYMGRASESGPQNEGFGNNPAPSETGSAPNVASSIQLQKKLFMGRASQSEPQKDVSTRDSVSSAPNSSGSAQPRKKALPSLVILGTCPAKPGRPPHVDLHPFSSHDSDNSSTDDVFPPPPPPLVPPPATAAPPPLPVRVVEEESYDDVGVMSKPGQNTDEFEDEFEDSETYEDIESRWPDPESEKTNKSKKEKESKKQKKKMEKEEKERVERERKEKKEMEKREQEARKRFKLKGPVEVVLRGSVKAECKGSKVDLELERGERVEVIRLMGNPAGCWLARNSRGYYGFVRTELVEVEGNTQPPVSLDVYDDVGALDQSSSPNKAPASENIDEDIYDLVDDGGSDPGFPPPPPPVFPDPDGDTYDDVAPSSLASISPVKTEDPKKKKRFEKEEKEFRKKFKYDQEIRVLYEAAVLPTLACKKFSGKHLVIKPGDVISVITRPQDGKVIGRNSEGKFGFVSLSNIQQNSDIYDDVGEDCIYDND